MGKSLVWQVCRMKLKYWALLDFLHDKKSWKLIEIQHEYIIKVNTKFRGSPCNSYRDISLKPQMST